MLFAKYQGSLMSDTTEKPLSDNTGTPWFLNLLSIVALFILVVGTLTSGLSIGGMLWSFVKWILSMFAIAILVVLSGAKNDSKGVPTFLTVSALIAAIVVVVTA